MTATASLLLGAALGLAHAVAGLGVARLASGREDRFFAPIVLGGTVLRLFAALLVIVVVFLFASVQTAPFLIGLGVTFVVGLVSEVVLLLRRPMAAPPRA
ncbi:MAG: hypothetical protein HKN04_05700 [Rhodothermaceae bacterium]|nr:hypothetical protein [Rhodothermaceae bacterium]